MMEETGSAGDRLTTPIDKNAHVNAVHGASCRTNSFFDARAELQILTCRCRDSNQRLSKPLLLAPASTLHYVCVIASKLALNIGSE